MTKFDTEKIVQLLNERKTGEVAMLIKSSLQNITKEEVGEAYAELAMIYMKVMSSINEDEINFLKTTISRLDEIKASKARVEDHIKLESVRDELNQKN
jgi:hypothetical protein